MTQSNSPRFTLMANLEPVKEIINDKESRAGNLGLFQVEKHFQLFYRFLDGSPNQHVTCIFQEPREASTEWSPNKEFDVDCRKVQSFSFAEKDGNLLITIKLLDNQQVPRIFSVSTECLLEITSFLNEILRKGIAVPAYNDEEPFSLEFYQKANENTYFDPPSYILLDVDEFESLDKFWDNVNKFFEELITNFDESDSLPRDPQFPLGSAATSSHYRMKLEINKFIKQLGTFETIKKDEIPSLFDENGKLKDKNSFKERAFHAGIEKDALPELLPFVFGVYDLDSTSTERKELDAKLLDDYNKLNTQVVSVKKHQLLHHKKLGESFKVITQDVERTDRTHNAFKSSDKPGMEMLTRLLRIYCMYNPPISYLQGMNDLFVPIIHAYFPIWDQEGYPVDANGTHLETAPLMPRIFWNYEAMIRNIDHLSLLSGVTEQCMEKARNSLKIITAVSPMITIWYKKYGLSDLLWIYADFVLLFKRTFHSIWDTWLQFNCAPDPKHWLIYFTAAIIIDTFPKFSRNSDISVTTMMDQFPKAVAEVDVHEVGNIALWLYKKVPFDTIETQNKLDPCKEHFDFFEMDWTTKAE